MRATSHARFSTRDQPALSQREAERVGHSGIARRLSIERTSVRRILAAG